MTSNPNTAADIQYAALCAAHSVPDEYAVHRDTDAAQTTYDRLNGEYQIRNARIQGLYGLLADAQRDMWDAQRDMLDSGDVTRAQYASTYFLRLNLLHSTEMAEVARLHVRMADARDQMIYERLGRVLAHLEEIG